MSQNINFIKRKRGRNHTNLSIDNCIKKAKVKIMRFIIHTSNKLIEKEIQTLEKVKRISFSNRREKS